MKVWQLIAALERKRRTEKPRWFCTAYFRRKFAGLPDMVPRRDETLLAIPVFHVRKYGLITRVGMDYRTLTPAERDHVSHGRWASLVPLKLRRSEPRT